MIHAIKRGLLLADFKELSVGMLLDYISQYDALYNAHEEENVICADQSHFNQF